MELCALLTIVRYYARDGSLRNGLRQIQAARSTLCQQYLGLRQHRTVLPGHGGCRGALCIEGRENLPPPERPVVYVANHQSFLDIYSLFHLQRPFKFISKTSNFLIPIIGWSMFLTGHVMINRVDRRSQLKCLQQCRELLEQGAPVLFFPEGWCLAVCTNS
ncbi:hypothetical protein Vretimale_2037 [Volvox reticuliferus]|nr:hypothetical protein Vretimale_2037 [Volvox reticuliferus]